MKNHHYGALLAFLLLCFSVEVGGGFLTRHSVETWYPSLIKPVGNPPAWVFGPIWTILYLLIAISGWLVYKAPASKERSQGLGFYGIQLFLNLIWSGLFFWLQQPFLGLLDIVVMVIIIILTIHSFWKVVHLAAILLIPYLLWTSYALYLNLSIWILNGL